METIISKLALNTRQQNSELVINISGKDKDLGQIVVIAQIIGASEYNKKIAKQIIEDVKDNYFNSVAKDSEKALEDALQKVNFSISETIKHTSKDWLNKSNVIIAAIDNAQINFTKIGKISAYLTSKKNVITIAESMVDEDVNPVKLFANIYSGSMPKKSAVIFLTENILDYISQEKIRKITYDETAQKSSSKLKTLLKKAPNSKNFGSVVIKHAEEEKSKENEDKKIVTDKELKELFKPKDEEEIKEAKKMKKTEEAPFIVRGPRLKKKQNNKKFHLSKFIVKTIIVLIIAISAWLTLNIFFGKKEIPTERQEVKDAEYQILLNTIQSKFIEGQNYLIIDDRKQAEVLFTEANNLINELPVINAQQEQQKKSFLNKINTQLLLAQNVNLTIPKLIQELPNNSFGELVLKENVLYTYDSLGAVYSVNLKTNEFRLLQTISKNSGVLQKIIDHTGDGIMFYDSLDRLVELDLESNKISPLEWNRSWQGTPIAADIYQNKMYTLTNNVQLKKYTLSITGFIQETDWLKEQANVSLQNAKDISIDGNIWILKENGEILKLFKGRAVEFTPEINPPLKNPTRLYTDLDLLYLYILDPGTKRVVVLNKSGKLITQFTSEEFKNLKDFAVDESARKIYLIDNSTILEVTF